MPRKRMNYSSLIVFWLSFQGREKIIFSVLHSWEIWRGFYYEKWIGNVRLTSFINFQMIGYLSRVQKYKLDLSPPLISLSILLGSNEIRCRQKLDFPTNQDIPLSRRKKTWGGENSDASLQFSGRGKKTGLKKVKEERSIFIASVFFGGEGNYIITRQQKESKLPTYKEFLPNFWDCVSGKQAYLAKEDGVICSSFLHFWRIRGASNQKCTHIAKCGFRSSSLIFWTWNRGRKIKWRKNPSILILERGGGCLFCNDISKRKKNPNFV